MSRTNMVLYLSKYWKIPQSPRSSQLKKSAVHSTTCGRNIKKFVSENKNVVRYWYHLRNLFDIHNSSALA